MPVPDHDADERIVWQGDYITAKTRGRWEYVGRPRNIRAAVILAVDDDDHAETMPMLLTMALLAITTELLMATAQLTSTLDRQGNGCCG